MIFLNWSKFSWNSDRKHEENEHWTTTNQNSEYDFYIEIGNVISTIDARRI